MPFEIGVRVPSFPFLQARPTGCMWYPYSGGKGDNQKAGFERVEG